jgi:hypothetical protein
MKRAEFRDRTQVLISTERDRFKEFQQLCDKESKSVSLKLKEMIEQELEKNVMGLHNPIAINFARPCANNSLDYYIDNGFVTKQYWKKELENNSNEKLEKIEAFGLTITETCKQIKHFKTTGRYLA